MSAVAVGGFIPLVKQEGSTPIPAGYEGVAANLSVPVFNGHLFSARREAARQRAMESDQKLRNEQERILRDVRTAWSGAITSYQQIDVTAQLLRAAALALDLAQGRYQFQLVVDRGADHGAVGRDVGGDRQSEREVRLRDSVRGTAICHGAVAVATVSS